MADEQVLYTGYNTKFIEGVTKMNQENWQEYFGATLESKILSGFDFYTRAGSTSQSGIWLHINDGIAIANGIVGKTEFDEGYFEDPDIIPGDRIDFLYCARIYFGEERIEIVKKFGITPNNQYNYQSDILKELLIDESAYCDRNTDYYEIPIAYTNGLTGIAGMDLRRRYSLKNQYKHIASLGQNNCYIENGSYVIDGWMDPDPEITTTDYIVIDYWNLDDAYVYIKKNGGTLYIQSIPWFDYGTPITVKSNNNTYRLPRISCELKGAHLSAPESGVNWASAVFNNPSTNDTKCLHIRKLYEDQNDAYLAHYLIEELY